MSSRPNRIPMSFAYLDLGSALLKMTRARFSEKVARLPQRTGSGAGTKPIRRSLPSLYGWE